MRKIFLPYKLMHHDVYRLAVAIVLFVLLWWNLPNRALKILDLSNFLDLHHDKFLPICFVVQVHPEFCQKTVKVSIPPVKQLFFPIV